MLHKEPSLHTIFHNVPLIIRFTYITGNKQWGPWRSAGDGLWCIWNCLPWKMERNRCCHQTDKE